MNCIIKMWITIYYELIFIFFTVICDNIDIKASRTVVLDYSDLAQEAESNKHNILKFLNQTRVQLKYKSQFNRLLHKLQGNFTHIKYFLNNNLLNIMLLMFIK